MKNYANDFFFLLLLATVHRRSSFVCRRRVPGHRRTFWSVAVGWEHEEEPECFGSDTYWCETFYCCA